MNAGHFGYGEIKYVAQRLTTVPKWNMLHSGYSSQLLEFHGEKSVEKRQAMRLQMELITLGTRSWITNIYI